MTEPERNDTLCISNSEINVSMSTGNEALLKEQPRRASESRDFRGC